MLVKQQVTPTEYVAGNTGRTTFSVSIDQGIIGYVNNNCYPETALKEGGQSFMLRFCW